MPRRVIARDSPRDVAAQIADRKRQRAGDAGRSAEQAERVIQAHDRRVDRAGGIGDRQRRIEHQLALGKRVGQDDHVRRLRRGKIRARRQVLRRADRGRQRTAGSRAGSSID